MTKSDEWVEQVMRQVEAVCDAEYEYSFCESDDRTDADLDRDKQKFRLREMLEERELMFAHVGCM